jgi:lipopolysaccharide export system protein LptA
VVNLIRERRLAVALVLGFSLALQAQLPVGIQVKANPRIPIYRDTAHGQVIDAMITFQSAASAGRQEMQVQQFDMRTFKEGDTNLVQLRALAPQCALNMATKVASDPGPLEIFTPTTNLYIQGRGFFCDQSQRLLIISNDVETRIVRSLLKAPLFGGGTSAESAGQTIRILADYCHFDSLSNVIDYVGHVRVFDPQGDSVSRALTIYLTTNNAVRGILARDEVTINVTNRGQATGRRAFYAVTNGSEQVYLSGDAAWHNGLEEAKAEAFTYDSTARVLHAVKHVRVRWPNPPNAATTYATLYSDAVVLQWPATNGPIESMTADGNVILANQSDQSRATGQQAVYSRTNGFFQITGEPVWWNDTTEVKGDALSVGLSNRVYHADGHAQLRLRDAASTNRLLQIACDHLNFQTNLAEFHDHVIAKSFQKGVLENTLTCRLLTADLEQGKVRTAVAHDGVQGESAPDAAGAKKSIRCETLTVWRSVAANVTEKVVGEKNVVLEQSGGTSGARDTLTADVVTGLFAPVPNRLDQAIAERHVVLDQQKNGQTIHAAADRAVYVAGTNGQMTLTGRPVAQTDKFLVSNSDSLIWSPQNNGFRALGPYKIVPFPSRKEP